MFTTQNLHTYIYCLALLLGSIWSQAYGQAPEIELILVEGGELIIDNPIASTENKENNLITIPIKDFYIGKYEITQAQYQAIMGKNLSYFSGCDNCPVENVSWQEATQFCYKLSKLTNKKYRLPTEAEWEYAARGGKQSKGYQYAGSSNIEAVSWYGNNSRAATHEVGGKQPNELGIYDMSGNVWEWCKDAYLPKANTREFILRGGSWGNINECCQTQHRTSQQTNYRDEFSGFRVVLVP